MCTITCLIATYIQGNLFCLRYICTYNDDDYNHIAHITIIATTTIITIVMPSSPSPLLPPTENKMLHGHQNLVITTVYTNIIQIYSTYIMKVAQNYSCMASP